MLAFELLALDERNVLMLYRMHAEMLAKKATNDRANVEGIDVNWLDCVKLTSEGDSVQSELAAQQEVA